MSVRDAEEAVRESYEQVPYPSALQHHTRPDHLAMLALLHGLEPAMPQRCRVLELGCADGGNLIPMAIELPESRFTGIDLSPRQIESGQAQVATWGLENVNLRTKSIMDVGADFGTFDYIIAHGVFSWVTPEVQEQIFAVCSRNLAPQGVAYISYNTLPGWHLRRMVRDMVLFHTRNVTDPEEQTARAFDLVRFLAGTTGDTNDAHALFLRSAHEHFEEYADRPHYLMHEYLERTNAPLYFRDFAARAARHDLRYLCEAEPHAAEVDNLPGPIAAKLHGYTSDPLELEQYVDFVVNRAFRRTLLTHSGLPLDRSMRLERMRRLFASSAAKPVDADVDTRPGLPAAFRNEQGKTFTSTHPVAKRVLAHLAAIWPRAASFEEAAAAGGDEETVADLLHALFWSGVAELHLTPPACTEVVSAHPRASNLARRQAMAGLLVTSQRGRVLKLDDPFARFILRHLDGTRDRAALVRLLDQEVAAGRLDVRVDDKPVRDPSRIPAVLQAILDHHLKKMADYALLVG
ncbi:MAG TPA: class I SAM-dependent methyltransferase [Thermoanaerobaculia bacterium]|nr:class I SAM-dependent methyltransferase [Thermoanaerobaculia bacterium]